MNKNSDTGQLVIVESDSQRMFCYENDVLCRTFIISTAKNGLGEQNGSECTPRGWHQVHSVIGLENKKNSVFVARKHTGEIYSDELGVKCPDRDWILSRIVQIKGLEINRNLGGDVDSLKRFIYFHGVPDSVKLGKPGSRGCVRLSNDDVINFADWVKVSANIYIK